MSKKVIIVSLLVVVILAGLYSFSSLYRQDISVTPKIDAAIVEYFKTNQQKYFTSQHSDLSYVEAHKIFKVEKNLLNRYFVYTYTIYGVKGNDGGFASGSFVPKVYLMKMKGSNDFEVIKSIEPMDGDDYAPSIMKMFPKEIANILLGEHQRISDICNELEKKLNYIKK